MFRPVAIVQPMQHEVDFDAEFDMDEHDDDMNLYESETDESVDENIDSIHAEESNRKHRGDPNSVKTQNGLKCTKIYLNSSNFF